MKNTVAFCFFDCETTGLNRLTDEIWHASWSFDLFEAHPGMPIRYLRSFEPWERFVAHTAPPSLFTQRDGFYRLLFIDQQEESSHPVISQSELIREYMNSLLDTGAEKTYLVCSNPSFDEIFLERLRQQYYPDEKVWHDYHLIDISALVLGHCLNMSYVNCPPFLLPPRTKDAYRYATGYTLDDMPHNAYKDRGILREIFFFLYKLELPKS